MQSAIKNSSEAMDTAKQGMPVTIITGFLGSGKTTLLNHILSNQQGLKTAVLVNEFGEIGIDNELIISTDDDMVELSNGCICCTINNDLVDAVYKVLERQDNVDYLVVETTGLADPIPVALTFLSTELQHLTRLDSIITVVDAANYSLDLFNSQAAYSQIAYGDIILLNKTDLVNQTELKDLERKILDIKDGARIIRTQKSQVPLALILSVGLFESDKYFSLDSEHGHEHDHSHNDHSHNDHNHDEHDHDHSHDDHTECGHEHHHEHDHDHTECGHEHHDHSHHDHHSDHLENDGFTSISFQTDQPFTVRKFQYFLDNQLPDEVFRAKGIMWFEESPQRHIFHLCGKRFTMDEDEWRGEKKNQVVLIGQNIDKKTLLQQLENCIA
jgi:G3E family GTPase